MHKEILSCIASVEASYKELTVAENVTKASVRRRFDPDSLVIDACVREEDARGRIKSFAGLEILIDCDGELLEMKPGRQLCVVWCSDECHCHVAKINRYTPAGCDCVPKACPCSQFILTHVKHCAEEYKDAVARVRLGITKLRAMPGSSVTPRTTPISQDITSDGCSMPGIRKAKHVKGYAKKQMEMHNSKRS